MEILWQDRRDNARMLATSQSFTHQVPRLWSSLKLARPVAVMLAHHHWPPRFGGITSIVGRTIENTDGLTTVVGVMPPNLMRPTYANVRRLSPRQSNHRKLTAES